MPCSYSELQAKPPRITWTKFRDGQRPEIISTQSDLYKGRVNMFTENSPGNHSLLLSHLTSEDEEWYRCQISTVEIKEIQLYDKGKSSHSRKMSPKI